MQQLAPICGASALLSPHHQRKHSRERAYTHEHRVRPSAVAYPPHRESKRKGGAGTSGFHARAAAALAPYITAGSWSSKCNARSQLAPGSHQQGCTSCLSRSITCKAKSRATATAAARSRVLFYSLQCRVSLQLHATRYKQLLRRQQNGAAAAACQSPRVT